MFRSAVSLVYVILEASAQIILDWMNAYMPVCVLSYQHPLSTLRPRLPCRAHVTR